MWIESTICEMRANALEISHSTEPVLPQTDDI